MLRVTRKSMSALISAVCATLLGTPVTQAQSTAENWPQRAITLIAPAPPGGSTDTLTRVLAEGVSAYLGQPVVVENRAGATGTISLQATLRAPADGYTFVMGFPSMMISSQFTIQGLPFVIKRDFQAVAGVAFAELVMSVHASVPASNPQELTTWLKTQGNNLAYGSYGPSTYGHVAGDYLGALYGVDAVHVPYKGEQPMLMALASNDVSYGVTSLSPAKAMQDTGKTRVIGIMSNKRSVLYPELPTFTEAGVSDPAFQLLAWYGIFARHNVPEPIVQKMEQAVLHALKTPKMQERLRTLSVPAWGATAKELEATWFAEIPVYEKLLRLADVEMH